MSRRPSLPAYSHHKPSGQARARINGRDVYLGPYGSPASKEAFAQLLLEVARQETSAALPQPTGNWMQNPQFKVKELILKYTLFAREYYGAKAGEYVTMREALKPVLELFGSIAAKDFGPKSLKCVRQKLIDDDICRPEINRRISRIRRAFRWATSEELIPPSVIHGLTAVQGLARGRSSAREPAPIRPVPEATVLQTLPYCSPQVRAMIQLQRLSGMRPGEVTIMRLCDIDRSEAVWLYRPAKHKTSYLGIEKEICLGPQAQVILQPFLDRPAEQYLFSPIEAEGTRNEERAVHRNPDRKCKVFPCELRARERRKAQARKRKSKRPKRDHFDTSSYRKSITNAILKASREGVTISDWHPHQLRHLRATEIRKLFGLEAAQVALGHSRADVTQIYAERNSELAARVAREIG